MKVLVCGGRDFKDKDFLFSFLSEIHAKQRITKIINGGARGADELSSLWAIENEVEVEEYPAEWDFHGRSAGPIRNKYMLDQSKPDRVIAFDGGKGTQHMIDLATDIGYKVTEAHNWNKDG